MRIIIKMVKGRECVGKEGMVTTGESGDDVVNDRILQ